MCGRTSCGSRPESWRSARAVWPRRGWSRRASRSSSGCGGRTRAPRRSASSQRYAYIARHQAEHDVRLMGDVLDVAPSGYYAWRTRAPRAAGAAGRGAARGDEAGCPAHAGGWPGGARPAAAARRDDRFGPCRADRAEPPRSAVRRARDRSQSGRGRRHHVRADPGGLALSRCRAGSRVPAVRGSAMRDTLDAELAVSALEMAIAMRRPAPGSFVTRTAAVNTRALSTARCWPRTRCAPA